MIRPTSVPETAWKAFPVPGSDQAERVFMIGPWPVHAFSLTTAPPSEILRIVVGYVLMNRPLPSTVTCQPPWRSPPKSSTRSLDSWATTSRPSCPRSDRPVHKRSHRLDDARAPSADIVSATIAA
jgi:hypothetical protein